MAYEIFSTYDFDEYYRMLSELYSRNISPKVIIFNLRAPSFAANRMGVKIESIPEYKYFLFVSKRKAKAINMLSNDNSTEDNIL